MNQTFRMQDTFGTFLADGTRGNVFRMCDVEPLLSKGAVIVFDFAGVENMTDSFANGCFANLAKHHFDEIKARVRFQNCSPLVKQFLIAALSRGEQSYIALANSSV